ncbi:hypothetical protein XacyCFBP1159_07660 [Xanthomonas arboricola pv. corylina]|nr:hypothetical protein XacyCFBP1159_07660 [Xanthomonas arboricola pv. corylina]
MHAWWGVGSGEWGVGSGEWGVGSGDWGIGNRESEGGHAVWVPSIDKVMSIGAAGAMRYGLTPA